MSEGKYGHDKRVDLPNPFSASGIVEPKNQWPRKMTQGDGGGGGYQRTAYQVVNSSGARIMGLSYTAFGLSVTNGTVVITNNGWWKGRTGYVEDLTGTGAVGRRTAQTLVSMSPIAMVAAGHSSFPLKVRLAMLTAVETTTMVAGGRGAAFWGLVGSTGGAGIPDNGSIGFVSQWTDPATFGAWSTWVANSTGSFTRAKNTQFATNEPHLLEVEFDGVAKLINFYVDGELVDSYDPAAVDLFNHGTGTTEVRGRLQFEANLNCVTRCMYHVDMIPWWSVTLVDL